MSRLKKAIALRERGEVLSDVEIEILSLYDDCERLKKENDSLSYKLNAIFKSGVIDNLSRITTWMKP